jgi:hypothetical protein
MNPTDICEPNLLNFTTNKFAAQIGSCRKTCPDKKYSLKVTKWKRHNKPIFAVTHIYKAMLVTFGRKNTGRTE